MNRETIEGVVEWIDGNGLWIKGAQRSRWVPLEALSMPRRTRTSRRIELSKVPSDRS